MASEPSSERRHRSALCVGVSRYQDAALAARPSAEPTAKEVARALEKSGFGVRVLSNPGSSIDAFEPLQKALRDAREGVFLLYFAGYVLERDGDLLLALSECDVADKRGGLPWSDVEDLIKRERVSRALLILNAEKVGGGADATGLTSPILEAYGPLRPAEPAGDTTLRGYADAVVAALTQPEAALEPYLVDEDLGSEGLERYLAKHAPKHRAVKVTGYPAIPLRSLRDDLERAYARASLPAPSQAPPAPPEPAPPAPAVVEPEAVEPKAVEPKPVEPRPTPAVVEPEAVEPKAVEPKAVEPEAAKPAPSPTPPAAESSRERANAEKRPLEPRSPERAPAEIVPLPARPAWRAPVTLGLVLVAILIALLIFLRR